MKSFNIIVACDNEHGISRNGKIPWSLKPDMKRFKHLTTITQDATKKNAVIMGRGTYNDCMGLSNRLNCVVSSSDETFLPEHKVFSTLNQALMYTCCSPDIESVWVIGGQDIYKEALEHPKLSKIYLTKIYGVYGCDRFFKLQKSYLVTNGPWQMFNGIQYSFHELSLIHGIPWANPPESPNLDEID